MQIKKTTWQIIKYASTIILTLGVITSVGLLSFTGCLLISPSIILAWAAFALAGFVEGEVYKQNIFQGMEELKLLGKKGYHQFIIQRLNKQVNELTKQQQLDSASQFLQDYAQQQQYVARFHHKTLTKQQKQERHKAEKRLRMMQAFFIRFVLSPKNIQTTPLINDDLLIFIQSIRDTELPSIKRKIWLLRCSVPLSLIAGMGFGLATASALGTTLTTLAITTLSGVLVWPLAIIACIGYAFLIYHTISDMLYHETVAKWRKKLSRWFHPHENENKFSISYGLRVASIALLLTLAIGLGTAATLATAGTWWFLVKDGALLIPHLARGAQYIRSILVPLIGITSLIFTIKNSLDTVKEIVKHAQLPRPLAYLKRQKEHLTATENALQILNPFRLVAKIISLPFQFIVLIGHLAASGLTSDHVGEINPIVTATIAAASDAMQDLHYFNLTEGGDAQSSHHSHDHDHSNISQWALKIVLSPLLLLAATWACLASQCNQHPKPVLGLIESLRNSFGIAKKPVYDDSIAPPIKISSQWITEEIDRRFDKQIRRLDHVTISQALAKQKQLALKNHQSVLLSCLQNQTDPAQHNKKDTEVTELFNTHRLSWFQRVVFFNRKPTKTAQFIQSITADYRLS